MRSRVERRLANTVNPALSQMDGGQGNALAVTVSSYC
jgi:hypothetical protein